MKVVLLFLFLAYLVHADDSESAYGRLRLQPQPRQIFRDGFNPGGQPSRRPSLKDLRERREGISRRQSQPTPTPHFESPEFPTEIEEQPKEPRVRAVEDNERDSDRASFSRPRGPFSQSPPQENQQEAGTSGPEYVNEDILSENPEYIEEEDYREIQEEPSLNYVNEEEEYKEETRSPSHRYPDQMTTPYEVTPSFSDHQLSSVMQEKDQPTPVPLLENEFSPFAMFKSDNEDDPPAEPQNPNEQFLESSSQFEFATNPFRENRFTNSPVEERTYETETAAPQFREHRPSRKAPFSSRRPVRQPSRHPNDQLVNPNSISQGSFYDQQQKRPHQLKRPSAYSDDVEPDYYSEDYEDKPDRLSELLLESEFSCVGRKDGYYADEFVNCEVFHFCQDNVKHSWLCPNEAAFHQVHLICLPRSEDNICAKSSKFHFVNDFLYKEVGEDPENRSYVERYYPQGYESGIANIPHHEGRVPPAAVSKPSYYRPREERPAPPPSYRVRPTEFRDRNEDFQQQKEQRRPDERPRHPDRPSFSQRHQRPVFQEKEVVEEENPTFFESEGPKPNFIEPRRPAFQPPEEIFERPVFEEQRPLQREEPKHSPPFKPFHRESAPQVRPAFEQPNRSPEEGTFNEGPIGHSQSNFPNPSLSVNFEQEELREHRPRHPQPIQLEAHEPPVYRPQPTIFRANPLKLQALQSVKRMQFRPAPEGRQQSLLDGPSLGPFFQLG